MMEESADIKGLVARDHNWYVKYRVTLDSCGPFSYRILDPVRTESDQIEAQIIDALGPQNIKKISVKRLGNYDVAVTLEVESSEFIAEGEYYGQSAMGITARVEELLPEDHLLSVVVVDSRRLGSHGPRR